MDKLQKWIMWAGRVLGTLMLAFVIFMFTAYTIGDGIGQFSNLTSEEQIGFILMFLMLLGIILGWKWKLIGALLLITGWIVFSILEGKAMPGLFLVFPVTGILFLTSWALESIDNKT